MRLWTIHPSYLDAPGLVALWREGLLAKNVLSGLTRGYKNHPQLNRFYNHPEPIKAINCYLNLIWIEANSRGYNFDNKKISPIKLEDIELIPVTIGQVQYEFHHLKKKVEKRSKGWLNQIDGVKKIKANPIFKQEAGPVEAWEKTK